MVLLMVPMAMVTDILTLMDTDTDTTPAHTPLTVHTMEDTDTDTTMASKPKHRLTETKNQMKRN